MENSGKFQEYSATRRVVIGLGVGLFVVLGLFYFFRGSGSGGSSLGSAKISKAPDVASIPGAGTPSAEYVKAQELANIELAKQAKQSKTESAIPTITRTVLKEVEAGVQSVDGCDIESLKKAKEAGVTSAELRCRGCSAAQLKTAGYTAAELRAAGFSASELVAAGYTATELRNAGFTASELVSAGVSASELLAAGYEAAELMAAGVTMEQLRAAGYTGGAVDVNKDCSVAALRDARASGQSAADLKTKGCGAAALRAAGFSAAELKSAGFTAGALKEAGFTSSELKAAGFTATELRSAGFTASELREAGYSATELLEAGFSSGDLIRAGFSSSDLATGCDVSELKREREENNLSAEEVKKRGCSLMAMAAAGYPRAELLDSGFDIDEINTVMPSRKAESVDTLAVADEVDDPMQKIRLEQMSQLAEAERMQQIQEIESAMLTQATQLVTKWGGASAQAFVEGAPGPGNGKSTNPVDLLPPSQVYKARAGDVVYAVLDTEVNTDERSPVMASVVSGRLKGAKLMGNYTLSGESAVLNFARISLPNVTTSSPIAAVAIDADTAKTALSTDVDHHYLLRYGSLFASSFLKGFSDAIKTQGSTTITGSGAAVSVFDRRSNRDRVYMGLGEVGSQYGKMMAGDIQRPVTVTVKKGTGFGLLFTNDTKIPLVDVERK